MLAVLGIDPYEKIRIFILIYNHKESYMKLKQVAKKVFNGKDIKTQRIGIFKGEDKPIYPDYADEMLEIYGDFEVKEYTYVEKYDTLVVQFEGDNGK